MLTWSLCDRRGALLADVPQRAAGSEVTVTGNGERTAKLRVSLEDEVAARVYPLATLLKVHYFAELLFCGPVLLPRFAARDRVVEIPAICPSFYLQRSYVGQRADGAGLEGAPAGSPYRQQQVDQSLIMWRLVKHVLPTAGEQADGVPTHGIVDGTRPQSAADDGWNPRDREYEPGKQIWQALVEMSEVLAGPDFELEPVDQTDGTLARLNVYGRQGANKTDSVVFEVGLGQNNATDVSWEPSGDLVANRATYVGQTLEGSAQPAYTANQRESQRAFGLLSDFRGRPDISDQRTLQEHAMGQVALHAWPVDFFTVTPAAEGGYGLARDQSGQIVSLGEGFGVPPRFGPDGDYWIGDEISAYARVLPGLDAELRGRVTEARLMEADAAGTLMTEITCAPTIVATGVS